MSKIFILFTFIFIYSTAAEENWTRFRGESGQGVSNSTIPLKLTKDNRKWSFPLKGGGSSSPVIWGNKLFITASVAGSKIKLYCLDTVKGKEVWSKEFSTGSYHMHRFNNNAASTPCLTKDLVIITWFNNEKQQAILSAFSHDGLLKWETEIGPYKSKHGYTMNPVVAGDKVILPHLNMGKSFVGAYGISDGKNIWKTSYPAAAATYATPLIRKNNSGAVFTGEEIGMMALDLKNGKLKWQFKDAYRMRTVCSPIEIRVDGETYISASSKGYDYTAIKLPSGSSTKAVKYWNERKMGSYVPTHMVHESMVYILKDSGTLSVYDIKAKKKTNSVSLSANFYASPIKINNNIYCISRSGKMFIISPTDLKILHTLDLEAPEDTDWVDATPAAVNGSLFIRLGKRLDCYR